ncbi:MAG: hypothetical protein ACREQH_00190 [Candidatus Binatus sp.]
MKSKVLMIAMLASALSAAPAWATWHGAAHQASATPQKMKVSKPSKYHVTLSIVFSTNGTSGPCIGGVGNADYCPSFDCTCYTATGTVKGSPGKGSVTLYETFDNGGSFVLTNSGCAPAYGDIEINGSKDVESLAFIGSDCGSSVTPNFLLGGCQLTDSNLYPLVGLGACGGNYSLSTPTNFPIQGRAE